MPDGRVARFEVPEGTTPEQAKTAFDGFMATQQGAARPQQGQLPAEPQASPGYGLRQDGTEKGTGFLGELKRPDGGVSTEISVGVDYGSGEKEIPTLVPTLTEDEKNYLLGGGEPTKAIIDKAVQHAISREEQGLSPFAGPGESPAPDRRQEIAEAAMAQYPLGQPAQEDPGILGSIGNMFSGKDRETSATENLPELQNSGLLAGLDIPVSQKAALSVALATMVDPEEIAKTLQAASPDIGIQYDEKGNILAANNKTGARAVLNKPGFSGLDAIQGASIASAFAPTGRATSLVGGGALRQAATLGATSAATQAALEGTHAAAGGDFNESEVGLAGGVGAAFPLAGSALGSTVDTAGRLVRAATGAPASESSIVKAATQANIPLMTSDVAQPSTFMGKSAQVIGERIPLAGTGGLRATQQEARQKAIQELGSRYPTPSSDQIIASLKSQKSKIKQLAGQRYNELVPKVDSLGATPFPKTSKAIDDALSELTKPGVMKSKEAIREIQQFRQTLGSAPQTYSTLKENRTALREAVNSYDAQGRSQLPSRAKSLMERIYSSMSSDMDDASRAALSARDHARLKEADAIWRSEAEKLTKTRMKNVLDKGDLTPEVAESLLFSRKRSEVQSLYNSLDTQGRDAARATVIQRAITNSGGIDNPSPEKFISEMRKLERQTGILFKGDQRKQLEGLKQVLIATKRAGEAGVQTATGQQLYAPIGAAVAGSLIGDLGATFAGGASVGAIARAYESPVVRNAMIRIGSAPKSEASKRLALQLARQLNAGAQSARAQSTEGQPQTGK